MGEDGGGVDEDCNGDDVGVGFSFGVDWEEREVRHVYCAGGFSGEIWR